VLLQPALTQPRDELLIATPVVDVVVPVLNEAEQVASSVRRLRKYLDSEFPFQSVVTIVDNGSTDATLAIANRLALELDGVRVLSLEQRGRGRALRAAWSVSEAAVVVYTDVDLSTSLQALLPLVAPLLSGHSDLAIGSRLARGARVRRGAKRELISRCYNFILRSALGNGFSDAQCGFKAVRTDVVRRLLPLVDDEIWFFDTELLVLAERSGLRIHEVPVDWVDDPDSRVRIAKTATDDLRGVARLLLEHRALVSVSDDSSDKAARLESAMSYCRVGAASTLAYLVLFLLSRGLMGDLWANAFALVICTIANLTVHSYLGAHGARRSNGLLIGGTTGFITSLALTSAALAISRSAFGNSWRPSVVAVLVATLIAGVIRFCVFRSLAFQASHQPPIHLSPIKRGDD
jgi:glycosyltransferase involved in cell wall biosynthesis